MRMSIAIYNPLLAEIHNHRTPNIGALAIRNFNASQARTYYIRLGSFYSSDLTAMYTGGSASKPKSLDEQYIMRVEQ
ncbi:hypothetical protein DFR33_11031 [Bradymonas sediminis]|uniref:Uncharacterized protein n=2 Tax=Bradymonas sediminis TaxID=1548548 RepID=A0A2Z4FII9_9DELT|nr:hypothetical protein DN745_05030 [Bradymonas sediminis]TDP63574.1 hypothetical protein DFR33_11031 [Bradymonas sediminis]